VRWGSSEFRTEKCPEPGLSDVSHYNPGILATGNRDRGPRTKALTVLRSTEKQFQDGLIQTT
jgi:hypothetical protein